jgi:predicted RNase H-like nuclease (RuvC/YqgF family)
MSVVKELTKVSETKPVDPLADKIRDSILGVENLRAENSRLANQVGALERANLQLESEVQSIKLTLEHERSERRHYHSLANEIITRLDVVGQTIDDVVKRAEQEVYRQRKENPRAELPEVKLPAFLKDKNGGEPASASIQPLLGRSPPRIRPDGEELA